MKYIKYLYRIKNKTGDNKSSFGLFLCEYCNKEVIRILGNGKRQKSCGCMKKEFISEFRKGRKQTEEAKIKNSESHKGEKNYFYGKHHTEETRKLMSDNHADINGENNPNFGKPLSEEHKQKIRNSKKGRFLGQNHWNWKGGISFEPYGLEFNKQLKTFIKLRDLNICQTPNCFDDKRLCVHHIDYDKNNNDVDNLITLCISCHMKSNYNRNYYQKYYSEIIGVYL